MREIKQRQAYIQHYVITITLFNTSFIVDTLLRTIFTRNKYVGHPYCRAKMYASRVACCPLVSHGE